MPSAVIQSAITPIAVTPPALRPTPARLEWWLDARFGVSYHWGLYAAGGRGEWVRAAEQLSPEAYRRYFDTFDPVNFDPRHWARLAKRAGAGYAILTTKHHDGFCLFDSKLTDFNAARAPAGRDLVRQYVDAFREEGLRVGLYYSLVDWNHPEYPAFGDRQHPRRNDASMKDVAHDFAAYRRFMHGQVRELMTNYGTIDLLVFDFSYWQYTGEAWGATDLMKMIRDLQPNIVLNDRLGNGEGGSLKDTNPPEWAGDFDTCELNTPHDPPVDAQGRILPWELWITHNNSWGYGSNDHDFKQPADVIRTLANCVSKAGNLTFNMGPDARGRLHPRSEADLHDIARWMSLNADSVRGCTMADLPRPDFGRYTLSNDGKTLFAHVTEQPMGHLTLRGLRGKVRNPRLLATGAECFLSDYWNKPIQQFGRPDDVFLNVHKPVPHTFPLPDPTDTVIAMDVVPLAEQPAVAQQQTSPPDPRKPM
ncbi:MAG: alpha-L-fucosidase [Phycisphaerae bacterium]